MPSFDSETVLQWTSCWLRASSRMLAKNQSRIGGRWFPQHPAPVLASLLSPSRTRVCGLAFVLKLSLELCADAGAGARPQRAPHACASTSNGELVLRASQVEGLLRLGSTCLCPVNVAFLLASYDAFATLLDSSMPSAIHTVNEALGSLSIKAQKSAAAFKQSSQLKVQPLQFSGALDHFEREELAVALGDRFAPNVRLKELLALPREQGDPILRDLAILSASRQF